MSHLSAASYVFVAFALFLLPTTAPSDRQCSHNGCRYHYLGLEILSCTFSSVLLSLLYLSLQSGRHISAFSCYIFDLQSSKHTYKSRSIFSLQLDTSQQSKAVYVAVVGFFMFLTSSARLFDVLNHLNQWCVYAALSFRVMYYLICPLREYFR